MKRHKNFFIFIIASLLCSTVHTYAFHSSFFEFVFKNETNGNIVTIEKITNPSGATLKHDIGPTNMRPNDSRHFFLLQYSENDYDDMSLEYSLTVKMSWLLTVSDKKGKIICQNRVSGWVKGKQAGTTTEVNTSTWRYNISSIQNSPDINMCPFQGMFVKKLPRSYKKDRYKCYPLVVRVKKDNSLTVD